MPLSNLYSKQQSTNTVVIMSLLGNFRLNERQVIQARLTKILSSFLHAELDPVKTDVSLPVQRKKQRGPRHVGLLVLLNQRRASRPTCCTIPEMRVTTKRSSNLVMGSSYDNLPKVVQTPRRARMNVSCFNACSSSRISYFNATFSFNCLSF